MDKNKVKKERQRLVSLLEKAELSRHQREVLAPVIDNLAWQRVKLDEAREEMQDASVVCEYNNGGGQTGTRENPIFKAYVNLWRAYMLGLEKYTSYLPKEYQAEAVGDSLTVLEQVQKLKKVTGA